jgi:hypothetical protein
VLRWLGDLEQPFAYEIVGNLDSEGAELALHERHLFISTWPNISAQPPVLAGIFMSPLIPEGGLTTADADGWQKVWQVDDYEPDPLIAATYGGGALASFDGYLVWGTMHVPFLAAFIHSNVYGAPGTQLGVLNLILQSHRAISIFRVAISGHQMKKSMCCMVSSTFNVRLIRDRLGKLVLSMNNMGVAPLLGFGICQFYNNYTWTMGVFGPAVCRDDGLQLCLQDGIGTS